MTIKSDGTVFLMSAFVRVLANPGNAVHPDEPRRLVVGDVFRFEDALNGNIYWVADNLPPDYTPGAGSMQAMSVEDVEKIHA